MWGVGLSGIQEVHLCHFSGAQEKRTRVTVRLPYNDNRHNTVLKRTERPPYLNPFRCTL